MHPHSATGLYWSIRGEVACADHSPDIDDPRWREEFWGAIPLQVGAEPSRYQCQHCAIDGRAVIHNHHTAH